MKTPYELDHDWIIVAIKVKNLIFMCELWTERKKKKAKDGQTEKEKLACYRGLKFAQYALSRKLKMSYKLEHLF